MVSVAALFWLLVAPAEPSSDSGESPTPPVLPDDGGADEPAVPEAADTAEPVEPPQPEPEPVTTPEPAPVTDWTDDEPGAEPLTGPGPLFPKEEVPAASPREPWMDDYVRVKRPRWNGTGMIVVASLSAGGAVLTQAIDSLLFGDTGIGVTERVFLGATMGLSAGAGIQRAKADAYDDTVFGRDRPKTRPMLIAGAALTGVGATLGLINEGLWWRCAFDETGPYFVEPPADEDEFFGPSFPCRYGLTRGLLDLSAGATSIGLGLLTYALVYERHARAYEGARVISLRPSMNRRFAGLMVEGRF